MSANHCEVRKAVSRGKGQSVVAKAAYNARTQLDNERLGEKTANYGRKGQGEIAFGGIFVPTKHNAPDWISQDRNRLWNAAANAEGTTKNAREGQEIIAALPYQLTDEQRRFIVTDFARELARSTGRVVDVHIHRPPANGDERNYHVHMLMTVREIGPNGFGEKLPEIGKADIREIKEKWSERGAKELRKAGLEIEAQRWAVGHLNLAGQRREAVKRGDLAYAETLDRQPTRHRGPTANAMEREGVATDRGNVERQGVTANVETAKLKAELAEVDRQIRQETQGKTLEDWQREQADTERPKVKPAAEREPTAAKPFGAAAQESTRRPEQKWESSFNERQMAPDDVHGPSAEIWKAFSVSQTAAQFVENLRERGILLAVVADSDRPAKDARSERDNLLRMKEQGVWMLAEGGEHKLTAKQHESAVKTHAKYLAEHHSEKKILNFGEYVTYVQKATAARVERVSQEAAMLDFADKDTLPKNEQQHKPVTTKTGTFVAVAQNGNVYQLDQRTTGKAAADMQRFMSTLDAKKFGALAVTRELQLMTHNDLRDKKAIKTVAAEAKRASKEGFERGKPHVKPAAILNKVATKPLKITMNMFSKILEGAFSILVPDVPKTPAQIEKQIERGERAAAQDEIDWSKYLYNAQSDKVVSIQEEQARQKEREGEDWKRQRGDGRDR